MARIRQIKPSFFVDEDIMALGLAARLMFVGMWTLADRDGRLEDKPLTIKMQTLPVDAVDPAIVLAELNAAGLIHRYVVGGKRYISIPGFVKHQKPHPKEPASIHPAPSDGQPLNKPEKAKDIAVQGEPGKDTAKPGEQRKETDGREKVVSSRADSGSLVLGSGDPETRKGSDSRESVGTEASSPPSAPAPAAILKLPCMPGRANGPREWPLTEREVGLLTDAFPGVDVVAAAKRANVWLVANPGRRKTFAGMFEALRRWIARDVERGITGVVPIGQARGSPPKGTGYSPVQGDKDYSAGSELFAKG